MGYVIVRHKVDDWHKWKPVFDEHGATRTEWGSKNARVFQNAHDSNEVVMLFEWDLEKAHKFIESDELKHAMEHSGVVDKPDFWFLEEADNQAG